MVRRMLARAAAGVLLALPAVGLAATPLVTVTGKVVDARDGSKLAKAEVVVRGQIGASGAQGEFAVQKVPVAAPISFRVYRLLPRTEGLPEERYEFQDLTVETPFALVWANAEVEVRQEGQVRKVPAYGWTVADLSRPGPVEVKVALRDPKAEFCRECHPENGYLTKKTMKAKEPWPVTVDAQFYQEHRFRDLHPSQVLYPTNPDLVRRRKYAPREEILPMLPDGERMTCFTCHAPHRPGAFGGFVIAEYEMSGALCRRCHR